jgi:hypothetical protein
MEFSLFSSDFKFEESITIEHEVDRGLFNLHKHLRRVAKEYVFLIYLAGSQ